MKYIYILVLSALSLSSMAADRGLDLPSCNLQEQRAWVGKTGGQITDIRQAHISERGNVLIADISTSRKARKITEAQAKQMSNRIEDIRLQSDRFVKQQGFLSAAENASFDRDLDAIAQKLCQP
ncbi:hypothetical protein [Pseudomonas kitaguniensis]|uniref:hypothetical protein n=1 Tax=Pseudomonas kitaguniensis TaxID=2607908 RepID=UPI003D05584D